jgi:hypothetical protein
VTEQSQNTEFDASRPPVGIVRELNFAARDADE